MALTSLTKDFITRAGLSVEGTSPVTTATYTQGSQAGTFQVAGGAAINKNLIVGTTSTFYGATTVYGTLTATNAVNFTNTLNVTGLSTFVSATATNFTTTNLTVTGPATLQSTLNVTGQSTLGALNAAITTVTTFYATGESILQGVTAGLVTATSLVVTGQSTLQGVTATSVTATTLTVSGAATVSGNLIANSNSAATGAANGSGALQVTGGAGISGALYVGGTAYVAGDLYVDGTQFVVNKNTISSGDNALVLSTGSTSAILANGAGLYIGQSSSTAYISLTYDGVANWVSSGGVKVNSTASVSSTNTGALQVAGGLGVAGGVYAAGAITATNINAILGQAGAPGNIYGGAVGQLVYQTGASQTGFIATGTNGTILEMAGGIPTWTSISGLTAGNATTATNIQAGLAYEIPYQSAPGQTAFSTSLEFNPTGYGGTQGLFTTTNIAIGGGNNATAATGASGSLMVTGGAGISQDLWVGGNVNVNGSIFLKGVGLDTISGTTGTFVNVAITGTNTALNVTNSAIIGQTLTATNISVIGTAGASSTNTGALQVAGGVGVAQNMYVGGVFYGGPTQSTIGLANPLMVLTNNVNGYTQIQIQNTSTGNQASSDFIATANNGTDSSNYIDMGINNSGFSTATWTISGANDGYLYVDGGNLTLGTDAANKYVYIHTGGTLASNIVASFYAANTSVSSTNTGALTVAGGVGISGGLFVGGAVTATNLTSTTLNVSGQSTLAGVTATILTATSAVINTTLNVVGQSTLAGVTATAFTATSVTVNGNETVNGNLTVTGQTILGSATATNFTATTATVVNNLTVGGESILQGVTAGLVTATTLSVTGQTTLGSTTATNFTATTATIVSNLTVNGESFLQGVTATVVTATSLTVHGPTTIDGTLTLNSPINLGNASAGNFTATTATITSNLTVNGISTFTNTVYMTSTTNSTSPTTGALQVTGGVGVGGNVVVGGVVYGGNTGTVGTTVSAFAGNAYLESSYVSATISSGQSGVTQYLDTFSTSSYRSAEYTVQITDLPNIHVEKIMLFQDGGTNVYMTEYAVMTNNGELGTFDAAYSGTNVVLKFTPTSPSSMVIKLQRTAIAI